MEASLRRQVALSLVTPRRGKAPRHEGVEEVQGAGGTEMNRPDMACSGKDKRRRGSPQEAPSHLGTAQLFVHPNRIRLWTRFSVEHVGSPQKFLGICPKKVSKSKANWSWGISAQAAS